MIKSTNGTIHFISIVALSICHILVSLQKLHYILGVVCADHLFEQSDRRKDF